MPTKTSAVSTVKPEWLKPRTSLRKHRLPKGWRWLEIGEAIKNGDQGCDPRIQAVTVTHSDGKILLTAKHHPHRRKVI